MPFATLPSVARAGRDEEERSSRLLNSGQCEERSDEAIQQRQETWIASLRSQ